MVRRIAYRIASTNIIWDRGWDKHRLMVIVQFRKGHMKWWYAT